jgi:hypothetical protein
MGGVSRANSSRDPRGAGAPDHEQPVHVGGAKALEKSPEGVPGSSDPFVGPRSHRRYDDIGASDRRDDASGVAHLDDDRPGEAYRSAIYRSRPEHGDHVVAPTHEFVTNAGSEGAGRPEDDNPHGTSRKMRGIW